MIPKTFTFFKKNATLSLPRKYEVDQKGRKPHFSPFCLFTNQIKKITYMAGKVKTVIKVNLKAGEATPAPPLGPALGQHGVAIMEFVKAYNDKTQSMKGEVVPAVITIFEDRSFEFEIKKAPVSEMIKKELGLEKGSGNTPKEIVATLSKAQIEKIAKDKLTDLNTDDLEQAQKVVAGTARSMGVKTE